MKKRVVIFSALLLALSIQVFAQENNSVSISDYFTALNSSLDSCREEYNQWLVTLDNKIESAKESILSEEDKQYYINIFEEYKIDIKNHLITIDELEKKSVSLAELCKKPVNFLIPSKSTKIDIVLQEMQVLTDSLELSDRRLRRIINSAIETFELDIQWEKLFASIENN